MKKTRGERPEQQKNRFWQGLGLGVFCTLLFSTAFIYAFLSTGSFRITLDPNQPALFVRDQIKAEALSVMSLFMEKMKVELPIAINQAYQDPEWRFISFEEGAVSLPREVSEVAKGQFQKLAEKAVLGFLSEIDLTPYIEELGQVALSEVKAAFNREVVGKTFHYDANPLLPVPVTVSAR